MTPSVRFPLALAGLLLVAACATPSSEPLAAGPGAGATAPDITAPATPEPPMTCQADKGQWAIGQIADEALVAKVQADTAAERVRVIKPGMAVTMDYREDRLNLEVDADNRVRAVRCS